MSAEPATAFRDAPRGVGSPHPARWGGLMAVLIGLAWAAAAVALFGASGRDDPYITFSAAESIRDSQQLSNINGDTVEQSTSLLYTVVLAVLSWVTRVPVPPLGWALSLMGLVAVVVLAYLALRPFLGRGRALAGAAVVGGVPPLVYWSASGAEQVWAVAVTLGAVLLAGYATRVAGPLWTAPIAGLVGGLAYATRPDLGLALLGGSVLLILLRLVQRQWSVVGRLLLVAGTQTAVIAALTLTRLAVTGSPVPQPLLAKVGGNLPEQLDRGTSYLLEHGAVPWFAVILLAGVILIIRTRRTPWTDLQWLLLTTSLVALAGLLVSGGDWMEAGRFLAAPAALLTTLVLSMSATVPRPAFVAGIVLVLALELVTLLTWSARPGAFDIRGSSVVSRWELQTSGAPGVPASIAVPYNLWNADHLGDGYFLGAALPAVAAIVEAHPDRTLTLASGQGGMVPYYVKREFGSSIRFIDRFQLMTDDFNDCEIGSGPYGSFVSWNVWEANAGGCAPDLPDLVFSIGEIPYDDLGDDYEVLVQVQGSTVRNGDALPQTQWLAVRKDLL